MCCYFNALSSHEHDMQMKLNLNFCFKRYKRFKMESQKKNGFGAPTHACHKSSLYLLKGV